MAEDRLTQQTERNKAKHEEDLIGQRIDKLKKDDAIQTILRLQQYHNDMTNKRLKEEDERVAEQKAMKQFLIEERKEHRSEADHRRKKLQVMIETVSQTGRVPKEVKAMMANKAELKRQLTEGMSPRMKRDNSQDL